MSHAAALSPVLMVLVALLVVLGAGFALVGAVGLLRLETFYERIHPPTMGTTFGVGLTLTASMLMFSGLESRPVLHEIVLGVFVIVTTPVTFMLLVQAARHRDRGEADRLLAERKPASFSDRESGPEARRSSPE